MIVDPNHNIMIQPEMANANDSLIDSPPSYDVATDAYPADKNKPQAVAPPTTNERQLSTSYRASTTTQPTMVPSPTVYNYTNPRTGERIVSLLPPNHPEMICLQEGMHLPHTKYGLFGILAAVFWFPLGIGLCLLDRRVRCSRCGLHIDNGICG
ncbi:hypothetical protein K443DRAFT_679314 [Laccaria amethystina LaAM-08-1]|uniref:Brain protein I3 n=1 Tax=Laccaria amethystina LaAM-08-1 TaxID=1095629 RepID=A0A0C9XF26_9AGAR|nr:hypothetical protein K443DRAFT_679314 [Laccaria amethystina LaAM-08-1]